MYHQVKTNGSHEASSEKLTDLMNHQLKTN